MKKTITTSDLSGNAITDGEYARITVDLYDGQVHVLEVTKTEAAGLAIKGKAQQKRGRKPAVTATTSSSDYDSFA